MQASAKITQTRRFFTFINPDNDIEFCFSDDSIFFGLIDTKFPGYPVFLSKFMDPNWTAHSTAQAMAWDRCIGGNCSVKCESGSTGEIQWKF